MALTIGISFRGDPRAAHMWSGIPAGVAGALESMGCRIAAVNADLPRPVKRTLSRLPESIKVEVRSMKAARQLRGVQPLDGVIQMGFEYRLPPLAPLVTLDDMTVAQGIALGDPWFIRPSAATRQWVERARRTYARAQACCAASHWVAESLLHDFDVPPAKVHVVGLGRNFDPPPIERDWTRPRFLFVGREWERKNLPGVVRAFRRLRRELPAAQLDIVAPSPPLRTEGVIEHGALRLSEPAERRRLAALWETATCYVCPSHYEAYGLAFQEAAAAGIPSIGPTVGGSPEVIGPGGRLVPPRDDDAIFVAMRELAEPSVARALGTLARRHCERFTWRRTAEGLVRALDLPLPSEPARPPEDPRPAEGQHHPTRAAART